MMMASPVRDGEAQGRRRLNRALFGAHQSFHLRDGWLTKGLSAILEDPFLFSDAYAADTLGVGRNMVAAIRYWLQAMGLAEARHETLDGRKAVRFRLTRLGQLIWERDPYLEDEGTLWVLHYEVVANRALAPTWYWFFNRFGVRHFTQDLFLLHLERYIVSELQRSVAPKTLEKEFRCLVRTYARSAERPHRLDDAYDSPFVRLNLLEVLPSTRSYRLVPPEPDDVHPLLVAYALARMTQLADPPSSEAASNGVFHLSLRDALYEAGSPGRAYVLDSEQLYERLQRLETQYGDLLAFSRTAGLNTITLRVSDPLAVFVRYYEEVEGGREYA